jgi:AraC-like DNA-binding protein
MSKALSVYHGPFGRATLYDLDRPMTPHTHREGHLIFFLGGSPGVVTVSGTAWPMMPDTVIAVNPWDTHAFTPVSEAHSGVFLVLYLAPQWFMRLAGPERGADLHFPVHAFRADATILKLIGDVERMLVAHRTTPLFERALLDLGMACRQRAEAVAGRRALARDPFRGLDFRVRRAIGLMDQGLAPTSIDRVARACGLSRAHFFKLFRANTGLTPTVYLNTLLVERALDEVAASDRAITDIGDELGFSSQSVFTRFFASHVGMPPTDYRRVAHVLAA